MAGGAVAQGREMFSDDSECGERATPSDTPDVHMPSAKDVGRRIELLLDELRTTTQVAAVPPIGQKLQFSDGDAVVGEQPAYLSSRQPAVPACPIIFNSQTDG